MASEHAAGEPTQGRIAAIALIAASAGTVLAMGHHPTLAQSEGTGGLVHGALILFQALMAFGFILLSRRLGLSQPGVLAGLVAYAIGVPVNVGAASISGFIVPALASRGMEISNPELFLLAWEANQALSWIGVFATGAAFILWSIELVRRGDRENRIVGILGLLAGSLPLALLVSGSLIMTVSGAYAVYAIHVGWTGLVGVQLWRGKPDARSC